MSNRDTGPYRSPKQVSEAGQTAAGWSLATKALIVMGVLAVLLGAGYFLLIPVAQFSEINRAGPPIEIVEEEEYDMAVADETVEQETGGE